jgi:hypothetical protein
MKKMLGRPSESDGKKRIKEVDENNAKKMKLNVWNKIESDWKNLTKERHNTRLWKRTKKSLKENREVG